MRRQKTTHPPDAQLLLNIKFDPREMSLDDLEGDIPFIREMSLFLAWDDLVGDIPFIR
jgi:hypothetical protein